MSESQGSKQPDVGGSMTSISIDYEGAKWALWKQGATSEPLVKDVDFAVWLEFDRPRNVRNLIYRHASSLGEVCFTAEQTSPKGGRPSKTYYLTEAQALYLAAKSETPRANYILKTMIAVFMSVRHGKSDISTDFDRQRAQLEAWVTERIAQVRGEIINDANEAARGVALQIAADQETRISLRTDIQIRRRVAVLLAEQKQIDVPGESMEYRAMLAKAVSQLDKWFNAGRRKFTYLQFHRAVNPRGNQIGGDMMPIFDRVMEILLSDGVRYAVPLDKKGAKCPWFWITSPEDRNGNPKYVYFNH